MKVMIGKVCRLMASSSIHAANIWGCHTGRHLLSLCAGAMAQRTADENKDVVHES